MIRKHRERGTVEFVLGRNGADAPYLMGSWDSWQRPGIPMLREPGEPRGWRTEVALPPGEHQFRYRAGDNWLNDPSADGDVPTAWAGGTRSSSSRRRRKDGDADAALHPRC
jgi:hypothetical protein